MLLGVYKLPTTRLGYLILLGGVMIARQIEQWTRGGLRAAVFWGALLVASVVSLPVGAEAPSKALAVASAEGPGTEKLKNWRQSLLRATPPKGGCFEATYPHPAWREVVCTATLKRPHGPGTHVRKVVPLLVGSGNGDFSASSAAKITTAEGSFMIVSGDGQPVTETGLVGGKGTPQPNSFALQLNTNQYLIPWECGYCAAEVQFVFSTNGCSAGLCVFIQTWLVGYLAVTPAGVCPGPFMASGTDCYTDSVAIPITGTSLTIADLPGLTLTGSAQSGSAGYDKAVLGTASGHLYMAQALDEPFIYNPNPAAGVGVGLGASSMWSMAEFNVFGDCCGDQANFSIPATLVLKTAITDGTGNPPACINQSFTAETNNLTLANATPLCCPYGGTSPAVEFMEGNAMPAHTAKCGASQLETDIPVVPQPPSNLSVQ